MLSDLSDEAQRHAEKEEWGPYRNVRYDTAEYVRKEGEWKRAGFLYVEVLIFDLQGVTSAPGVEGFHEAYQHSSPAVVREVARFARRADMRENELKAVYERVADQVWTDAFPRSRSEVWEELRATVRQCRKALQLEEKVEALGPDQLLSEAEAQAYIEQKSEYEIIRRVEQLLETEHPARIPPKKRERAQRYLAAIEPEHLGDRWKGKAYRRGGEVMLSQNGTRKALEYFEQALSSVDRDEVAEVERIVNQLRGEVKT
jgi:hypothetical protein